jgi:hypothetical protein
MNLCRLPKCWLPLMWCLWVAAPTLAESSPLQALAAGRAAYGARDCGATRSALEPLAVPGKLTDSGDQLDVHRMLGICYASGGDERAATREFASMLAINPDAALDEFEVPPAVVALFNQQQQAMRVQLEEIRRLRATPLPADPAQPLVAIETTTAVERLPWAVNFVPFGVPQFLRGQTAWGAVLGIAQGLFLTTNVVAYWASLAVQAGRTDGVSQLELTLDHALWWPHVGGLVLFAAAYAVGVIEAFAADDPAPTITQKVRRLTPAEASAIGAGLE